MASSLQKACKNLSLNDSLRSILECPLCLEFCHTPILQCINGHHICSNCQPSVTNCPTCGVHGRPSVRSNTLDKVEDQVKTHCANKREGCKEVLNATDMAEHWETCKEKYTYPCWVWVNISASVLYNECKWRGDRGALVAHVKEKHPGCYSEDDVMKCDVTISFTENVGYRRLVSAHGELFWVCLGYHRDQNKAYIYSCCIGKEENAARPYRGKFVYSSRDGHTENTSVVDTKDLYSDFDLSSTNVLRLLKDTLEEYMLQRVFSFTVQIIKQ